MATRVVVIGAGPGGYPAAFLAADLGMEVTLIDPKANPGGVCLYEGCIPSKALLHVAKLLNEARDARDFGVEFGEPKIDPAKVKRWKEKVVGGLTGGLGALTKTRRVKFVQGRAKFADAHGVTVDGKRIDFDHAIVATGSRPVTLPGFPTDPLVMDSTGALELDDVPASLLVVGGGYIGLEMATVYAALGSRVTVVEMTPGLLPGVDRDLVEPLAKRLKRACEAIYTSTKVTEMKVAGGKVRVTLSGVGAPEGEVEFDKTLVAVGRRPNSEDLGLDKTRVQVGAKGFIETDPSRRTHESTIYAIGDVAGGMMLAHKATAEARVAVESIAGEPSAFEPSAIPAVVFTDPEVAWCGLTEEDARKNGVHVKVAKFPWAASGRAATLGRRDGLTKLVLQARTERILGVGMVGTGAGELIAEGVLAVEMGATVKDLSAAIHAHPTLSETVREAAEAYYGQSPHFIATSQRSEARSHETGGSAQSP